MKPTPDLQRGRDVFQYSRSDTGVSARHRRRADDWRHPHFSRPSANRRRTHAHHPRSNNTLSDPTTMQRGRESQRSARPTPRTFPFTMAARMPGRRTVQPAVTPPDGSIDVTPNRTPHLPESNKERNVHLLLRSGSRFQGVRSPVARGRRPVDFCRLRVPPNKRWPGRCRTSDIVLFAARAVAMMVGTDMATTRAERWFLHQ